MATKIVTKNSSTASAVPTASDLVQGELAVNVADKKLFTEDNSGAIIELADGVKLAGIEASADVTDTANVTAAGALMDSELTSEASVKALDQGVATTDSPAFAGLTVDTTTLAVDSTNNRVGIGTSSPSNTLDVAGTMRYDGRLLTNSTTADGSAAAPSIVVGYDYDNGFFRPASNTIGFTTGGSERMRIDSSGHVGIGTTSPSDTLSVVNLGSSGTGVQISSGTSSGDLRFKARTESYNGIVSVYDSGSNEDVRISAHSGVDTYFNSGSKVGIGTASPSKTLVVNENDSECVAIIKSSDTGTAGLFLGGQTDEIKGGIVFNNSDNSLQLRGYNNTERMRIDSSGRVSVGTKAWITADANVGYFGGNSGQSNHISFYDSLNLCRIYTNGSERLRIDSSGNLLVGSSSSNAIGIPSVEVGGSNGNGLIVVRRNTTSAASQILFKNPNGYVGQIQTNGSATSYITSSDYRLKENVVELTGATERLKQLNPSRFNFIADADTTVDGFLAHEVADVVPEAISGEKDAVDVDGNPEYQGIDQSKLVPLLVATIQELEARITQLENN